MKYGPDRRIRKRPEFQAIQRVGRRISTKNFVLIVAQSSTPGTPARLGVTASKRVGNSVRRSRLKRVVRAAFRTMDGVVPDGHSLVVICKSDPPGMTSDTVVQEWRGVARKIEKALNWLELPAAERKSTPRRP